MHTASIPIQRYPGRVVAFGSYGLPSLLAWRPSRRTVLIFALVGIVLGLYAAGVIDGHGAFFIAGPIAGATRTPAAAYEEQAYAKLLAAKELADPEGNVSAENEPQFNALMGEFRDLDKQANEAALAEAETNGNVSAMRERFSRYQERATGSPMRFSSVQLDPNQGRTMGQQFVASDAYQKLKSSGALQGSADSHFRTDRVVLGSPINVGAAASDIIQTESGGPAAALVQPYRPGLVLPLPQRPTIVRDLFANENMPEGDTIEYAAQTGFDNAAAAVAQAIAVNGTGLTGGVKPQSSIAWAERSAKASWIANWMAATRQALADDNQIRSLIDNQGRLMVRIAEDEALVNGNGTAPNISGIRDQVGLQLLDLTGEDNLDGFRTGRRLVKTGLSRLDPTFAIINPIDSEEFDLLKDGMGQYRGGNPIGNFNMDQSIWRLQRAETEAIPEGIAIIGARAGATVYERQPISVIVGDQHADFLIRNLVVILFEERIAFPVYFPTAFVEVTLSDWVS